MSPSVIYPTSNSNLSGSQHRTSNGKSRTSSHPRKLVPGVYVPTVAFFDDDEEIDLAATQKHAARLSMTGITGIVTHGSNGEAVHLDREERIAITKATREALDSTGHNDMPIIVGCGAQSTRETIRLCREAAKSDADYALVLPPNYYSSLLTSECLLSHFRAVADSSPIPLLIYNFPSVVGGVDLNSDQLIALSKHPKIAGVKLTCGNTGKLCRIVSATERPSFFAAGGSADFILPALIAGGDGVIAGLANLAPKSCVKIMSLYQNRQFAQAQELQAIVARADWVAIQGGFVAVKSALGIFEGYGGGPRGPCVPPDEEGMRLLEERLKEVIALERSL